MAPFLETGNESIIANAKKLYRRKYKANWRRTKRGNSREITTTWEKDEYGELKAEAIRHRESVAGFLKKATKGYMDKRYVMPKEQEVKKLIQLLALVYNSIGELQDEGLIAKEVERKVLGEIAQLEHDIRILLFSPKTIEQVLNDELTQRPELKPRLIAYIKNLEP